MRSKVIGIGGVAALALCAGVWSGCSKQEGSGAAKQEVKAAAAPAPAVAVIAAKDVVKTAARPSDEEIVKAIDAAGVMNRPDGSVSVVPPVKLVKVGKQNKDGGWPVMAKFTIRIKGKDGTLAPPVETTASFRIFSVKDAAGQAVWTAKLGT